MAPTSFLVGSGGEELQKPHSEVSTLEGDLGTLGKVLLSSQGNENLRARWSPVMLKVLSGDSGWADSKEQCPYRLNLYACKLCFPGAARSLSLSRFRI